MIQRNHALAQARQTATQPPADVPFLHLEVEQRKPALEIVPRNMILIRVAQVHG
jgi:hypothetical protein